MRTFRVRIIMASPDPSRSANAVKDAHKKSELAQYKRGEMKKLEESMMKPLDRNPENTKINFSYVKKNEKFSELQKKIDEQKNNISDISEYLNSVEEEARAVIQYIYNEVKEKENVAEIEFNIEPEIEYQKGDNKTQKKKLHLYNTLVKAYFLYLIRRHKELYGLEKPNIYEDPLLDRIEINKNAGIAFKRKTYEERESEAADRTRIKKNTDPNKKDVEKEKEETKSMKDYIAGIFILSALDAVKPIAANFKMLEKNQNKYTKKDSDRTTIDYIKRLMEDMHDESDEKNNFLFMSQDEIDSLKKARKKSDKNKADAAEKQINAQTQYFEEDLLRVILLVVLKTRPQNQEGDQQKKGEEQFFTYLEEIPLVIIDTKVHAYFAIKPDRAKIVENFINDLIVNSKRELLKFELGDQLGPIIVPLEHLKYSDDDKRNKRIMWLRLLQGASMYIFSKQPDNSQKEKQKNQVTGGSRVAAANSRGRRRNIPTQKGGGDNIPLSWEERRNAIFRELINLIYKIRDLQNDDIESWNDESIFEKIKYLISQTFLLKLDDTQDTSESGVVYVAQGEGEEEGKGNIKPIDFTYVWSNLVTQNDQNGNLRSLKINTGDTTVTKFLKQHDGLIKNFNKDTSLYDDIDAVEAKTHLENIVNWYDALCDDLKNLVGADQVEDPQPSTELAGGSAGAGGSLRRRKKNQKGGANTALPNFAPWVTIKMPDHIGGASVDTPTPQGTQSPQQEQKPEGQRQRPVEEESEK